ncbi:MAG: hypothetical protein C0412_00045 [Flavobacterium sp.]|nr:hypothetical protein [Flavobacterium sp.]
MALVYHFIKEKYGIESIEQQRLKVSTITNLNDPFELLCIDTSKKEVRKKLIELKKQFASKFGILCYSKSWQNPVQWSHYADRHKGMCLGFSIPQNKLVDVQYEREKLFASNYINEDKIDMELVIKIIKTKYYHWQYENEVRQFVPLGQPKENGLFYVDFSSELVLNKIIIGANSKLTKTMINNIQGVDENIKVIKARPSFKKFEIVQQKKLSLWR